MINNGILTALGGPSVAVVNVNGGDVYFDGFGVGGVGLPVQGPGTITQLGVGAGIVGSFLGQ